MTDTAVQIPFNREATELPDKNGTMVKVGDFIRVTARDDEIWEVYELSPREEHTPGNVSKKTGLLDQQYSAFRIQRATRSDDSRIMMRSINFEGRAQTSCSIKDAEKADLTDDQIRLIRLDEVNLALGNIDMQIAYLRSRQREYETKRETLLNT